MIIYSYQLFIFPSLISVIYFSYLAQSINSSSCIQSCGENRVQYPFGFSDECKIRLSCSSSGEIRIGDFSVRNVTSDQILINLSANCSRPISDLSQFYGANFAPTWRNGLLLENCSSEPSNDCVVPSRLLSTTSFENCNSGSRNTDHHNISCYSGGLNDYSSDFLDYGTIRGNSNCGVLFSSIMVGLDKNSSLINESSSIPLDFQIVELGWWLNGSCGCHPNAICSPVTIGRPGFRCKCNEGFAGDGFTGGGDGCERVSSVSDCSSSSGCGNKVGILVGSIFAGGSLAAALAIICYCLKRRSSTLRSRLSAKRLISEASGTASVPFYPYKDIERASNGFSEKQRLGTGAYGTVYAGKLNNDEWVAIKKLRYRDHESVNQVMNEIKLLSSVSHPNLVRLMGCCIDHGEQILVYEYMPNGTLSQHLQRERGSVLPWTTRLTIAVETAHAVAHLHSAMSPPIFHRDIKSSNILLDYSFNSKLADFGLSRIGGMTEDSHISTAPQGTPGYVDPQYHQNFHLSDKSDVYSFGVVLVEIITALKVVDFSRPHSEINLAALAIDRIGKGHLDDIIDPFLEPNRDAWTLSSVHKVAELAFRCLAFHRDMRPSMMEVADELELIKQSAWAPLDENAHMGSSVSSSSSSPYQGSEKSFNTTGTKKTGVGSKRLIVTQNVVAVGVPVKDEAKDSSPVSVQDVWLCEESSPPTNSLLSNVIR